MREDRNRRWEKNAKGMSEWTHEGGKGGGKEGREGGRGLGWSRTTNLGEWLNHSLCTWDPNREERGGGKGSAKKSAYICLLATSPWHWATWKVPAAARHYVWPCLIPYRHSKAWEKLQEKKQQIQHCPQRNSLLLPVSSNILVLWLKCWHSNSHQNIFYKGKY